MSGYGYLIAKGFYKKVRWWELADLKGVPEKCVFCGSTENLTIDHKLPKSKHKKARGLLANYQIACYHCNQKKGSNMPLTS